MKRRTLCPRVSVGVVVLVIAGLVTGQAERTRILHFPHDAYVGQLFIEDPCLGSEFLEGGRDPSLPMALDPERVCLAGDWDFVGLAQGDVSVPADRNVFLLILLQALPRNSARLPRQARDFLQNRVRVDPPDLSGIAQLDPNDLYQLRVIALAKCADADRRVLEPISRLTGLEVLSLSGTSVTARGMAHLRALSSLRGLELGREFSVGNAGLAVLKDFPALEYLDCDTAVTDAGLKHLAQVRNLRWLRLRTGQIWGRGLAELSKLPRLERLCLWGEKGLSDRHISYLEGLTRLKSLTLWGTSETLTDASLASIGKLTGLEELYFIRIVTRFTDGGAAQLKNLKNLRKVGFGSSQIGAEGLQHLAALPNLEAIKSVALSTESVQALASFKKLKSLEIGMMMPPRGTSVPREDLSGLACLRALEELRLGGGRWAEEDLVFLESLTNLKRLFISSRDISDQSMPLFASLKRLEYLSIRGALSKRGLNQLRGLTKLQTLVAKVDTDAGSAIDETPLQLSSLKKLKTLNLRGLSLQDGDLASLAGLNDLEVLWVKGAFTEAGLRNLHDLPSLKNLQLSGISCATGENLAHLAQLHSLGDLKLRGDIPDMALRHLPAMPGLYSFEVETEQPISPETAAQLRARLAALEYLYVREPPRFEAPPVRIRESQAHQQTGRQRTTRQTPRRDRRRR
jgi:internalin A